MRLLLDECVEFGLAKMLRASGHDVVLMQDVEPGADDGRVLELAAAQDRLLVTDRLNGCRTVVQAAKLRTRSLRPGR